LELDVLALHAPRQFPTLQADGGGASEEEQRGSRVQVPKVGLAVPKVVP